MRTVIRVLSIAVAASLAVACFDEGDPFPDTDVVTDTTPGDASPTACSTHQDCPSEAYCLQSPGYCHGEGVCEDRPQGCSGHWAPVCGCDGTTYTNDCAAAAAGVNVSYLGECVLACGAVGGPCPTDLFCELPPDSCELSDVVGHCEAVPLGCPDHVDPVCGCDGVTYGNDCERRMAAIPKHHDGLCACEPMTCPPGQIGVDSDGDGCDDSCAVVACQDNAGCVAEAYCAKAGCDGDGTCAPRPEACDTGYAPVCGCDGMTYSNACVAASAGVNVAHEGTCEPDFCGGIGGFPCPGDAFCEFEPGTCDVVDNAGTCVEVPGDCSYLYDPVCGCDGQTYDSDCTRRTARISKDHDGACEADCESNADCAAEPGAYCAKDGCDGDGTCAPRPEACDTEYAPVCGCDDVTYSNACVAASAGVNVAHAGTCGPGFCGGIAGFPCPGGEFCEFEAGTCHVVDNAGTCVEVPDDCTFIYDPVCGCDGVTYGNDCTRRTARVSKDHDGACVAACESNADCAAEPGAYCAKDGCEGPGECTARPDGCYEIYAPVCGCDGHTYDNDCYAAAAGMNVADLGPCPEICGGIGGIGCPKGQVCDLEPGTCDWADQLGTCVHQPWGCPDVWDPVCGCDRVTYGNDCDRLMAGVQLDHPGACHATAP